MEASALRWPRMRAGSAASNALLTAVTLAMVFAVAATAIYRATDGFRVVSTEDARRLAVAAKPRQIPETAIHDADGHAHQLGNMLEDDRRVAIVAFIYTRCNAVCSVLGNEFQQMQGAIQQRGLEHKLRLISISFDPLDGQPELASYAKRMGAQGRLWQLLNVDTKTQRQRLLDDFGIVVVPAPLGEFQHNAAFHIVTPDGKLVRIMDYDQPNATLDYALSFATKANGKTEMSIARTSGAAP